MKKQQIWAVQSTCDPHEPKNTLCIVQSFSLIPEKFRPCYLFIETDTKGNNIYQNVHTGKNIKASWAGPQGYTLELIDIYTKKNLGYEFKHPSIH